MSKKTTPKSKSKPQPDGEATVLLRHEFTKDERLELSGRQNAALNRIGELESQLASVKKDFMAKIQSEDAEVRKIGNHLNSGYEMRPTRVRVEFHPKESKKIYFALDDVKKKRKLGEEPMTASDYEMKFAFDNPAPTEGTATGGSQVTATPAEHQPTTQPLDAETSAIDVIRAEGKCSAALLMKRLKWDFATADSVLEALQAKGVIGPATGAKGLREILALPEAK